MFFNRNKKIAQQISASIMTSLRLPFMLSKHVDQQGNFYPPSGFWMDSYILGYTLSSIHIFLKHEFNGDKMSRNKYGLIILMVFKDLCGEEWESVMSRAVGLANGEIEDDGANQKGGGAALLIYIALTGQLQKNDLSEENLGLVEEAERFTETLIKTGNLLYGGTNISTALAVLTIYNHLKENYIEGLS